MKILFKMHFLAFDKNLFFYFSLFFFQFILVQDMYNHWKIEMGIIREAHKILIFFVVILQG